MRFSSWSPSRVFLELAPPPWCSCSSSALPYTVIKFLSRPASFGGHAHYDWAEGARRRTLTSQRRLASRWRGRPGALHWENYISNYLLWGNYNCGKMSGVTRSLCTIEDLRNQEHVSYCPSRIFLVCSRLFDVLSRFVSIRSLSVFFVGLFLQLSVSDRPSTSSLFCVPFPWQSFQALHSSLNDITIIITTTNYRQTTAGHQRAVALLTPVHAPLISAVNQQ